MSTTRRTFLAVMLVSGAVVPTLTRAQEASPASEVLAPAELLQLLQTATITTPLLPADLGTPIASPWIDNEDDDLVDTLGGVLVMAGKDEGAPLLGTYIVYPTPEAAATRLESDQEFEPTDPISALGERGFLFRVRPVGETYGLTVMGVSVGAVIVSASSQGEDDKASDLRAFANLTGLLDHLRLVQVG